MSVSSGAQHTTHEQWWTGLLGSLLGTGNKLDELLVRANDVRLAVRQIWDLPLVIPNFTDHSLPHNIRVFRRLHEIYARHDPEIKPPLSATEVFVLICANYLHDIGMQCAPPELLRKAGVQVKNPNAASFSDKDREEIRRHHHELSAIMIERASEHERMHDGEFSHLWERSMHKPFERLENSLQLVDTEFIEPISDVVRYHSSEADIDTCAEGSPETVRRRYLALLLRLADELDITAKRVNIKEIADYPATRI